MVAEDSPRFQVFNLLAIGECCQCRRVASFGGRFDPPRRTDIKLLGLLNLTLFGAAFGVGSLRACHVTSLQ